VMAASRGPQACPLPVARSNETGLSDKTITWKAGIHDFAIRGGNIIEASTRQQGQIPVLGFTEDILNAVLLSDG